VPQVCALLDIKELPNIEGAHLGMLPAIDLLAEFDKSRHLTLVSVGSLQSRLADILGADVDLSSEDWMREPVRTRALSEAVLAF